MVGQTIKDAYIIQERIGIGGMGRVYRAIQINLGRSVALKLLRPSFESDTTVIQRFHREARACSRLHHPNVIQVLDFGQTEDGALFIVMEYVPGRSLFGMLREEAPLAEPRAIHLAAQVLSALAEAHAEGIVHRDLKPENVMVESRRDEPEFVKVLDFGIAKLHDPGAPDPEGGQLTRTGIICGTPNYMSPEQAALLPLDARSDLYSVGIILYEMLTGHLPFRAATPPAMVQAHVMEPPPLMSERCPPGHGVSPALEAVVMKALEKNPASRFQNAEEMRRELLACPLAFFPTAEGAPALLHASAPLNVERPRPTPTGPGPAVSRAGLAARTPHGAGASSPPPTATPARPARPAPLTEALVSEASPRSPAPVAPAPVALASVSPAPEPAAAAVTTPCAPIPSADLPPVPPAPAPIPAPPAATARARSRLRLPLALAAGIAVLAAGALLLTRPRGVPSPAQPHAGSDEKATPRAAPEAPAATEPSPAADPRPDTEPGPAEPTVVAEPATGVKASDGTMRQEPAELDVASRAEKYSQPARPTRRNPTASAPASPLATSRPGSPSQRSPGRSAPPAQGGAAAAKPERAPATQTQRAAPAGLEPSSADRVAQARPEPDPAPQGSAGPSAGSGPATASPPQASLQRAAFVTREVVSFKQVFGDPQLRERGRGLVGGAHWLLEPGGTMTFAPVTAAHGLFPMKVRATREGNHVKFEGTHTARANDGLAYVRISGLLALGAADPLLTLDMEIGRALGPDGAELDPTYRARSRLRLVPE
jgi:serine/threonine protein kinase